MSWRVIGLTILLVLSSALTAPMALAANPDSLNDTLSDSRKSADAKHTVLLNMSAGTNFASADTISLTFSPSFTVPALTAADVSFDDGSARIVLDSCSAGPNNVGVAVSGQVVTLTACAGFTASSTGVLVTIVLGTGATQITNPSSSGIYGVTVGGSYGDDPKTVNLAIIDGVTVSLTIPYPNGDIRFTGDAFPSAIVSILDGGSVAGTTIANSVSFFDKTIQALSPGVHTFGVYGQDLLGRKTLTLSFNINVISGMTITISGILLPPVLAVPSTNKRPAPLPQSGLARHSSTVTTFTNNGDTISKQATTNSSGTWSLTVPEILHLGVRSASALVNDGGGNQSVLTDSQAFEILLSADLNIDNLINLTDFSILMFSYGLANPPNLASDINDSGNQVDLVDFSVMMFYWTGG